MKAIVVINGKGGVGKDTLCDFVWDKYEIRNVSSVDPIKQIARQVGWSSKSLEGRKFLSDLKLLCTNYNDYPFIYLMEQVDYFLADEDQEVMFVHIREPEEIAKFVKGCEEENGIKPLTMLVRRDTGTQVYGNMADDNVENYSYDIYFDNNVSLEDAKESIIRLFDKINKGGF